MNVLAPTEVFAPCSSSGTNIGAALLDCTTGIAFAFGQAAFDQCVNERQSTGEAIACELAAGDVGKDLGELLIA